MKTLHSLLAALFLAAFAGQASADRTPMRRFPGFRDTGTREYIRIPYVTNGNSAFGVYHGVAPRIYASPTIDDPANPQSRPAFNLPFYGARMGFGGINNGAVEKPRLLP